MENNIKVIRSNKKMSREELSEITGINYSTLSSYESFKRRAPLMSILKIAAALNVSPKELLTTEGLKELEGTVLIPNGDWSMEEALRENEASNLHMTEKTPAKVAACTVNKSKKVVGHRINDSGNIQCIDMNKTFLEKFSSLSTANKEDVLKYIDFLIYREKK